MKKVLQILIIEDSEDDALIALRCIEKGDFSLEYQIVQTAEEMEAALLAKTWDVILCDYQMPRFSGIDALEVFKKSARDIPFIIISGTIGEDVAVECMKAGADDYIMKGHLARLLPAIERGMREAENRAKRRELERELIQSQKMESLGTLASGIAHDFNNILAIISGYSEVGMRKTLAHHPDLKKCFDAINQASHRGALVVSQLLTYARKTETVFRPVDIKALVDEITMFFTATFPKTISISTRLEENLPHLNADGTQLHQVLMNLCVNARDAMPMGGAITICVQVLENTRIQAGFPKVMAQRYLSIQISDTGSGMDEKTKSKIFDPFFTTKGPDKGTGLGLALVHSIVENHRGMIDLETKVGKGTTFHLYFPIEEGTAKPEEQVKEEPARFSPAHQGSGTVLLIEDEPLIIEVVESVLKGEGYALLLARDGEEGVEMFARHQKEILVVLSDFGLPKMRGDEVATRIKAMDAGAKIILVSGFFDPGMRSRMAEIGVNRLLQKPFSFQDLTACLRSVIHEDSGTEVFHST